VFLPCAEKNGAADCGRPAPFRAPVGVSRRRRCIGASTHFGTSLETRNQALSAPPIARVRLVKGVEILSSLSASSRRGVHPRRVTEGRSSAWCNWPSTAAISFVCRRAIASAIALRSSRPQHGHKKLRSPRGGPLALDGCGPPRQSAANCGRQRGIHGLGGRASVLLTPVRKAFGGFSAAQRADALKVHEPSQDSG